MNALTPLRELLPLVRLKAAGELGRWYVEEAATERSAALSRLWADHFASVADYLAHKRRYPDSNAGAMVTLYSWAR